MEPCKGCAGHGYYVNIEGRPSCLRCWGRGVVSPEQQPPAPLPEPLEEWQHAMTAYTQQLMARDAARRG